jgi:elongator complex protein 3
VVVADLKAIVPPYVRIQRVERDIPTPMIAAGPRHSNLRQLARDELARRGGSCACIRCREAGHRANAGQDVDLVGPLVERRTFYEASGGDEAFLELIDGRGALHAFARVRRAGAHGPRGSKAGDAFLRELRVVGRVAELEGSPAPAEPARLQHTGLGARLLRLSEEVAFRMWGAPVLRVTAGVGVRGYYRKQGYQLAAPYMERRRGSA